MIDIRSLDYCIYGCEGELGVEVLGKPYTLNTYTGFRLRARAQCVGYVVQALSFVKAFEFGA